MVLQFEVKPYVIDAVGLSFLKWLWRYGIAAVLVYFLVGFLGYSGPSLIIALVVIVLVASILSIKHALIRVHMITYSFYDTHVVAQTGVVVKERASMPYKRINKVINSAGVWNRLTGASDILLKAAHGEGQDLRLRSIKNADVVEDKIYALLRKNKE